MKNFLRRVAALVLLALVASGASLQAASPLTDPLVGDWLYYNDHPVTFNADGTARFLLDGRHGTWEYLHNPEPQRHYRLVWDQGKAIDNLTLLEDARHAHVVSQLAPYPQYDIRRTTPDKPAASASVSPGH